LHRVFAEARWGVCCTDGVSGTKQSGAEQSRVCFACSMRVVSSRTVSLHIERAMFGFRLMTLRQRCAGRLHCHAIIAFAVLLLESISLHSPLGHTVLCCACTAAAFSARNNNFWCLSTALGFINKQRSLVCGANTCTLIFRFHGGLRRFTLERVAGNPNQLPSAATCFNTLRLPE